LLFFHAQSSDTFFSLHDSRFDAAHCAVAAALVKSLFMQIARQLIILTCQIGEPPAARVVAKA
jgi:hypothetical protein